MPAVTSLVTDNANVLSTEDAAVIEEKLDGLRERTGAQMAVLVVSTTHGEPIDDFAQEAFTAWGGGDSERDDGLLLVVAVADRQNRLHLGYGIEPLISDAMAVSMLNEMRPDLRAERYGAAIAGLVDAVSNRLEGLAPNASADRAFNLSDRRSMPLSSRVEVLLLVMAISVIAGFAVVHIVLARASEEKTPRENAFATLAVVMAWFGLPVSVLVMMLVLGARGDAVVYAFASLGVSISMTPVDAVLDGLPLNRRVVTIFGIGGVVFLAIMFVFFRGPLDVGDIVMIPFGAVFAFSVLGFVLSIVMDGSGSSASSYRSSGRSSSPSRSSSASRSSSSSRSSFSSSRSSGSSRSSSSRSSGGGGRSGGGGASSGW